MLLPITVPYGIKWWRGGVVVLKVPSWCLEDGGGWQMYSQKILTDEGESSVDSCLLLCLAKTEG